VEKLAKQFLEELKNTSSFEMCGRYTAAWNKISKYVKNHGEEEGLALDSVWSESQYKKVFIGIHCVGTNQFFECKKTMELWLNFLARRGVIPADSSSVVKNILFEDLLNFNTASEGNSVSLVYFRDIYHLMDVLEDAAVVSDAYDVTNMDSAICACILAWYLCEVEEMMEIEAKDVLDDRVIVSGREIVMPKRAMDVFHRYKLSPGAYMEVGGNITYARYKPSTYLFRSSKSAQATKRAMTSYVTRLAKNYDRYQIKLTHIRKSRIYHDVFQKECVTGEVNLKKASNEELSELFGVTIACATLKSRQLKDYKRYKELLYKR